MPYDKVTACVIAGTSNLTQENWSKWNGQTMWGRPAVKTAALVPALRGAAQHCTLVAASRVVWSLQLQS